MLKRVAIIGSGVSGLTAALLLNDRYEVHVLEKETHIGGHTNTYRITPAPEIQSQSQSPLAVDTGFIVFNPQRYPHFVGMLDYLGVASQASDMSFSVSLAGGRFEYASHGMGLLLRPKYWFLPNYWRLLYDLVRFYRSASRIASKRLTPRATLGDLIKHLKLSPAFVHGHLLPMAAAIWSSPPRRMLRFPAQAFLRFMDNHGLLNFIKRPQWRCVAGGSDQYVLALTKRLRYPVETGVTIEAITRDASKNAVAITIANTNADTSTDADAHADSGAGGDSGKGKGTRYHTRYYDYVVLAAHADESLALIKDATPDERDILGAFRFQTNRGVLHGDRGLMPRNRKLWASWNYIASKNSAKHGAKNNTGAFGEAKQQLSVTYWMNRLQSIRLDVPLFVSLNPPPAYTIDPKKIYAEMTYTHPMFDYAAHKAQKRLPSIQGTGGLYFCGAWTRWGFHEDGVVSAIAVAQQLGVGVPWVKEEMATKEATKPTPKLKPQPKPVAGVAT